MSKSKLVDKIGQFTTVPNSVIAMWPKIGLDAMALFVYLRYRSNAQTGDAFPSFDTIQHDTGLTRRRIAAAAKNLQESGLVERKRRFGASTIYTLKLPEAIEPISNNAVLMEESISNNAELSLVQGVHTNQIEINKIKLEAVKTIEKYAKTQDIQAAYKSCVTYPIDWAKGESVAAKWLAENGYTPDDVTGCYRDLKRDDFWKDKPLSLVSLKKQIGPWKEKHVGTSAKKVIKL